MSGVSGIVLAGGQGRRMGGVDKGLQPLRGKPMVEWVIERLAPQVDEIIINANQNIESYESFGHRVVPDEIGGFAGPLAGLHAGLKAAAHPLVVTVPCDSPFLPPDLVSRLSKRSGRKRSCGRQDRRPAAPGVRAHEARRCAKAWKRSSPTGGRKIDAWYAALKVVEVPLRRRGRRLPQHQHPRGAEASA